MNSMLPYLGSNLAMVGSNSEGKPVGQIAIDRAACDDRLRIVAFATQNRDRQGDYFNGMAPILNSRGGRTCTAADDDSRQMGDPAETSTATAIGALTGGPCTPIDSTARTSATRDGAFGTGQVADAIMLRARRPNAAQRDMPGLF
jgi:hypothetical protein